MLIDEGQCFGGALIAETELISILSIGHLARRHRALVGSPIETTRLDRTTDPKDGRVRRGKRGPY